METGSGITFSGTLVADRERLDGFGETSMTERGSMTGGRFLIRLSGR